MVKKLLVQYVGENGDFEFYIRVQIIDDLGDGDVLVEPVSGGGTFYVKEWELE